MIVSHSYYTFSNVGHLFTCWFATGISFWWGFYSGLLSIFWSRGSVFYCWVFLYIYFLLYSCYKSSLYVLENSCLLNMSICKYFLPIDSLFSYFLDSVFHRAEALNFSEVQLIIIFLQTKKYWSVFNIVVSKKSSSSSTSSRCSMLFSDLPCAFMSSS